MFAAKRREGGFYPVFQLTARTGLRIQERRCGAPDFPWASVGLWAFPSMWLGCRQPTGIARPSRAADRKLVQGRDSPVAPCSPWAALAPPANREIR